MPENIADKKPENIEDLSPNESTAKDNGNNSLSRMRAQLALSPVAANINTTRIFSKTSCSELPKLLDAAEVITNQISTILKGDLSEVEATLAAQAITLNSMFNELSRHAAVHIGTQLQTTETYLRLALKAQNQSRATMQTLADIKNPRPVAFVKQANISNGHQQVNNGVNSPKAENIVKAENLKNPTNELLEKQHNEWLDIRAADKTGAINSTVETMATINRPADTARQNQQL